jgi:hypothetical protein
MSTGDLLDVLGERLQRTHRGREIRLVAIDHVTLEARVAVDEDLSFGMPSTARSVSPSGSFFHAGKLSPRVAASASITSCASVVKMPVLLQRRL